MAGPGARRAEGLGAWMHSTIQGHRSLSSRSAPSGAFGVSGGEKRVPRPRGFDGFARSESGQPNGWPWSAPRGRVGCMDEPNNPRTPITISTKRPGRGVWRIWRREKGADAARVRRIRRERIRTAEWLALERSGRVKCMDAPQNLFAKLSRSLPNGALFLLIPTFSPGYQPSTSADSGQFARGSSLAPRIVATRVCLPQTDLLWKTVGLDLATHERCAHAGGRTDSIKGQKLF